MLSVHVSRLLFRVSRHLSGLEKADPKVLAAELDAVLLDDMNAKVRVADAARSRAKTGRGGRPARFYVLDIDPILRRPVKGVKAAHEIIERELKKQGVKGIPTAQSLAAAMSARGHWIKLVDTLDGMLSFTLRKATDKEAEQFAAMEAEETGTEDAS